jgi:hypothetical protein
VRRPEMTSVDECPHERRSRGDSFGPATGRAVLPPRSGFRRLFAHRCSRMIELDLKGLAEGVTPRRGHARPRAARRLLQPKHSASTTSDDPNSAHRAGSRPPTQLFSRMAATQNHFLTVVVLSTANRAFTGQGSGLGGYPPSSTRRFSARSLA